MVGGGQALLFALAWFFALPVLSPSGREKDSEAAMGASAMSAICLGLGLVIQ